MQNVIQITVLCIVCMLLYVPVVYNLPKNTKCYIRIQLLRATRNSAVADKPRDAFVQKQWRMANLLKTPLPIWATTPNSVVLGLTVYAQV